MRHSLPLPLATVVGLALFALPGIARAEPTTWFTLGTGYTLERDGGIVHPYDARATALTTSIGAGSAADHPIVIGGVFRATTFFSLGTDLSLSARVATGSFARGDWGVALDLGVVGRWWKGEDYGHLPAQGVLVFGIPFGFQVDVGGVYGDISGDHPIATGGFALIEFDFLRLTLNRSGNTTRAWPNPSPANAPPAPNAAALPGENEPGK